METCYNCDEPLTGPIRNIGDFVWDDELGEEVYEEFWIHAGCR